MSKIRVGIFFGGNSREREVSFAGGRTVYDNLDKTLFEPVPIFVDSFNNFCLLNWPYIYKGSIRDFYPPVQFLPKNNDDFQLYAESLNPDSHLQKEMLAAIGEKISLSEIKAKIDFAFLCLHGANGEDGRLQGLLEFYGIPYSGSGIYSSALAMNKAVQKGVMKHAGFNTPVYSVIQRSEWTEKGNHQYAYNAIKNSCGFPCVVKPANQGSSVGVTILTDNDPSKFIEAVNKAFFIEVISRKKYEQLDGEALKDFARSLCDIREGIGLPFKAESSSASKVIYEPGQLIAFLREQLKHNDEVTLTGFDSESEVLVEAMIVGKEFSCIVIRNQDFSPVALPPTEIRKGKELFDYRSKYLPGLSRKITPIQLPDDQINNIRRECEKLFSVLHAQVYARIDGFITDEGKVFLNDPNTTSGMMPSSFFFHQAAEIGLSPSRFLTYIIRTSIAERVNDFKSIYALPALLKQIDSAIGNQQQSGKNKIRIAVIMGGYSSERHISVESGRNIYEKLSSSEKYLPIPVFLTGSDTHHELYQIPINLLLKDNADDICEKIKHFKVHAVIEDIVKTCKDLNSVYAQQSNVMQPVALSYEQLAGIADEVFIALHGRPGEDGEVQKQLEKVHLPYNGSGEASSKITINKFETNEILRKHGMLVANHAVMNKADWKRDPKAFADNILHNFKTPFIAKPVDDGCSSAVKKIKTRDELMAFASLMFREDEVLSADEAAVLQLKQKEEFPMKNSFLVEDLISRNDAKHFLEITGGMLTHLDENGKRTYEVFEASEALSEGDVLSLEEKFLAGQGQNITPARYDQNAEVRQHISNQVKKELQKAAEVLNVEGYCRIDAFVRIYDNEKVEVIFIEVNSLPGMTPATCIFHQCAINNYKPYQFIDAIMDYGRKNQLRLVSR